MFDVMASQWEFNWKEKRETIRTKQKQLKNL